MQVAKHFGMVERLVKFALHSGNFLIALTGKNSMKKLTRSFKKLVKDFPLWTDSITAPVPIACNKAANTRCGLFSFLHHAYDGSG
jgi:D-lactate dehydrogenase